jgi:hypothetical protein
MRLFRAALLAVGIAFVALGLILSLGPVTSALNITVVPSSQPGLEGAHVEPSPSRSSFAVPSIMGNTAIRLSWSSSLNVTVQLVACSLP